MTPPASERPDRVEIPQYMAERVMRKWRLQSVEEARKFILRAHERYGADIPDICSDMCVRGYSKHMLSQPDAGRG